MPNDTALTLQNAVCIPTAAAQKTCIFTGIQSKNTDNIGVATVDAYEQKSGQTFACTTTFDGAKNLLDTDCLGKTSIFDKKYAQTSTTTAKNNNVTLVDGTAYAAPFSKPTLNFGTDAKTFITTTELSFATATTPGFYGWMGALFAQTGKPVPTFYYGKDASGHAGWKDAMKMTLVAPIASAPAYIESAARNVATTFATYSGAGPVPTGITSVDHTVELFAPDEATGKLIAINFMWKATLTAAAANTNTMDNMTCLNANATAGTVQYLCAVASSAFATGINITPVLKLYSGVLKLTVTQIPANAAVSTSMDAAAAKAAKVFQSAGSSVKNGATSVATPTAGDVANRIALFPAEGNYLSTDLKVAHLSLQVQGEPNNTTGDNTKVNTDKFVAAIKAAIGTTQMANSFGAVSKFSEAALAAPVAAVCAYKTAADCKASADCKSGALSTVVAVGASIAALAMAF